MRRLQRIFCLAVVTAMSFVACDPPETPVNQEENEGKEEPAKTNKPSLELQQADQFAIDMLGTYYLWSQQISKDLSRLNPDTCKVPMTVVQEIRYHESGKEVDHWTALTDNLESMTSSVQGLGLSYGFDLTGMWADATRTKLVFIVNYATKGKPAEKAGLKRGDIIWTANGGDITLSNYYDLLYNSASVTLGVQPGIGSQQRVSVQMSADKEWEDPVLLSKTFDVGGKKVGYLVYNSFDLKSAGTLPDIFRQFKADGISELILDLRYNGGGYTFTELELASLIAPFENVAAQDVFQTEVFNALLTQAWKDEDFNTYFRTKYEVADEGINEDITDANPGIKKLYAIVSGGSASASEGLIVGLGPYMDITLVGERTYGKYCAGYMMSPKDLYENSSSTDYSKITKWGIYVMVSKFADKNGNNAAQPDGIPVNISVEDDVLDGYQLGDENETMLKAALTAAGKVYPQARGSMATRSETMAPVLGGVIKSPKPRGILVKTDLPPYHFGD